jgi:1-phosphofructokinase family hexose kinase
MILCISPNPAIDRRLRLGRLALGEVNRARAVEPMPGGKAAHVAMGVRTLGEEVLWVGFLGGATGVECERGLKGLGIPVHVVRVAEDTRNNLEIIDEAGTVTEILEPGARVHALGLQEMMAACRLLFKKYGAGGQAVLSGSLPPGVPANFYAQLIMEARLCGCRTLLDTSGDALTRALSGRPDFIKPNRQEAEQLTGLALDDEEQAAYAACRLFRAGAGSVALSLGAEGMLWQSSLDAAPLLARPPAVKVVSAVGSGDASVAGFAVARARGLSDIETIKLAAACGTANCVADAPGRFTLHDVEALLSGIEVLRLDSSINK